MKNFDRNTPAIMATDEERYNAFVEGATAGFAQYEGRLDEIFNLRKLYEREIYGAEDATLGDIEWKGVIAGNALAGIPAEESNGHVELPATPDDSKSKQKRTRLRTLLTDYYYVPQTPATSEESFEEGFNSICRDFLVSDDFISGERRFGNTLGMDMSDAFDAGKRFGLECLQAYINEWDGSFRDIYPARNRLVASADAAFMDDDGGFARMLRFSERAKPLSMSI